MSNRTARSTTMILAVAAVACADLAPQESTLRLAPDEAQVGHRPAAGGDSDGAGDGDVRAPAEEVCDGWDNDRDGEVDEGTAGQPCASETGEGTTACVDGRLVCRECTPGESRTSECGCGVPRSDLCNDAGRWLLGPCDTCPATPTPIGCGFCGVQGAGGECIDAGECRPGEIMYTRCDSCAPGDPACGTACVGQKWQCQSACNWILVEDCAPRTIQCDRDEVLFRPCGMCGYQKVECDGCFWTPGDCRDEGICVPGTSKTVPCFDQACVDGLVGSLTCGASCTWESPPSCSGCIPGPPTPPATAPCVAGYDCGVRVTQSECVGHSISICGGSDSLVVGQESITVLRDDCPANDCLPGQTRQRPCTTGLGECGSESIGCTATCDWGSEALGACVPLPSACVPGTRRTETLPCSSCGATNSYVVTYECRSNGCGETVVGNTAGSCPPCSPGAATAQQCTMPDGSCGQQYASCTSTCEWGSFGACGNICAPGQTTQVVACPGGCQSYTVTTYCDGCSSWTTNTYGTDCRAECYPGQTQQVTCPNSCQVRYDSCDPSTCTWRQGTCEWIPGCG